MRAYRGFGHTGSESAQYCWLRKALPYCSCALGLLGIRVQSARVSPQLCRQRPHSDSKRPGRRHLVFVNCVRISTKQSSAVTRQANEFTNNWLPLNCAVAYCGKSNAQMWNLSWLFLENIGSVFGGSVTDVYYAATEGGKSILCWVMSQVADLCIQLCQLYSIEHLR